MSTDKIIHPSDALQNTNEALCEQARFLQILINAIPHAVFYKNTEGVFLGCNEAYAKSVGMGVEMIVGKTVHELFPPELADEYAVMDKQLIENPGVQIYEILEGATLAITKTTYTKTNGTLAGLIGIITDNTEQKRMEESLKMTEGYFRSFTESLQDCIAHLSLDGKYLSINPAGCEILEFGSCEKAVGVDFVAAITENREAVKETLRRASQGETTSVQYQSRGEKGKTIWWDAKFSPVIDLDGSIKNVLAVCRDISDQKRLEEQLHQAQEAEKRILTEKNRELEKAYGELKSVQSQVFQQEKMASIGQLAAGVAHEINNPMGFIISNLGTLRKYSDKLMAYISAQAEAVRDLSSPSQRPQEVVQRIEESKRSLKIDNVMGDLPSLIAESLDGAERVRKIVQDFKGFSHVDQAEHQFVDINECLESTINIVRNELKYKATLQKELGDLPKTWCNPGQLNQVFVNILVNAAHAMETQGTITVKTGQQDGVISIEIQDTGRGIPKENVNKIFEPFFTTKEVGKGTGLGLSIAYDIIKKHKGDIAVKSEVGKGTTFTITLPIVKEPLHV
jgi:PAS domain S-box-containing protein